MLVLVDKLVVKEKYSRADEQQVWQEKPLDNLQLSLPPKPVQYQLHKQSVIELVWEIAQQRGKSHKVCLVRVKPSKV